MWGRSNKQSNVSKSGYTLQEINLQMPYSGLCILNWARKTFDTESHTSPLHGNECILAALSAFSF